MARKIQYIRFGILVMFALCLRSCLWH